MGSKYIDQALRADGRERGQLRPLRFSRNHTNYEGSSVEVALGNTCLLCCASLEHRVPGFLRGKKQGWVTAEYGMLPGATHTRTAREAKQGRQSGRTQEIQRLIGRSLRASMDLRALGEKTIILDCDVIQADGGTRTAAINGAYVALYDLIQSLLKKSVLKKNPIHGAVAAVSAGIYKGEAILDLSYSEDREAEVDMNIVANDVGNFVEVQSTSEGNAMRREELDALLDLGLKGVREIIAVQYQALSK